MDPINIPPMLAYIPYMDPIGIGNLPAKMFFLCFGSEVWYSIFRGRCHRRWARECVTTRIFALMGQCPEMWDLMWDLMGFYEFYGDFR